MWKTLFPWRETGVPVPVSSTSQAISRRLQAALDLSSRPVLLIGGGADKDEARRFSLYLGVPTYVTWNALDTITSDCLYYAGVVGTYGGPGRNFGIQNCDFLLAIGSRISGRITGGMPENFAPKAVKWVVDIDPVQLKHARCNVSILGDAGDFMREVRPLHTHPALAVPRQQWVRRCMEWRDKYDPVLPEYLDRFSHYGFVRKLSAVLPSNAIVVSDTGGNVIMMGQAFRAKTGQRLFTSNGNTAMGFAFCGALGAWFADKTRPVICLIGDGGFNMNLQELQTLVNYGCNVKVFILNNHCYGNTKLYQHSGNLKQLCCGPDGYRPPDFVAIAKAYKIPALRLTEYNFACLEYPGAVIVDVVEHDFFQYYPRISRWDQALDDQDPPLPRDEYEANRI